MDISTLFRLCCDFMEFLASVTGYSYEALNMVFFYVVQPYIYCLIIIWQLFIMVRHYRDNKVIKYFLMSLAAIPILYIYAIYTKYSGADLYSACHDKMDSMCLIAEKLGITYIQFNIYVFVVLFLIICGAHTIFLKFSNTLLAKVIFTIILLTSPLTVFVFFT